MDTKKIVGIILLIASLICLIPGLTHTILSLKIGASLPLVGTMTFHESAQSILQTVETLHKNDNTFVAFLILFFSVLVPGFKTVALFFVLFLKPGSGTSALSEFITLISKWSMADVFVVGVFITFLATRSNEAIDARIGSGFYWFLAYCLLSIAAAQVISFKNEK